MISMLLIRWAGISLASAIFLNVLDEWQRYQRFQLHNVAGEEDE